MELEHVFWTEKREANYGFAQTISVGFRFETIVNETSLCYRLALNLNDDPTALFSCVLNAVDCAKFAKNLAQFPKNLHELVKNRSATMDLVNIEDRVVMSIRAQQTDSELPCFSALFGKAPLQEQHQHMIFMVTQLKAELAQERQVSNLLRSQNDQLLLRLRSSEETSTLIQRAIETLISSPATNKKHHEPPQIPVEIEMSAETAAEKLKMNEDSLISENSSVSASPAMANVQLQDTRDDLLLGIASYLLCAVCEKVSVPAANSTELSRHFIDEHVDDAKCLACPDANVFDLLSHIKTHTHRVYACNFCGKKGRKHYLKSHVRTHTGEKPFKCQTCGRKFADQSTIRRHQTTVHSMQKKFICPICGRDISRKDNYRVHLKSHNHSNNEPKQAGTKEEKLDQEKKEKQVNVIDSTENSNSTQVEVKENKAVNIE